MNTFAIRNATPDDIPALLRLIDEHGGNIRHPLDATADDLVVADTSGMC
jgi:N-acetylglutamate synthase-like GNAT family acetyltransferase